MAHYEVRINGKKVWKGDGDSPFGTIPPEFLERPADTYEDEPHPPTHDLYEDGVLIGRQTAHTEESEQILAFASPIPADVFAAIANAAAHPDNSQMVEATAAFHPDDVAAVVAAVSAAPQLAALRAGLAARRNGSPPAVPQASFVNREG